jgi:hypothetical protein
MPFLAKVIASTTGKTRRLRLAKLIALHWRRSSLALPAQCVAPKVARRGNLSAATNRIVASLIVFRTDGYTLLAMGKNIALFIDGTGNNGPRDERLQKDTNVYKLYLACDDIKHYQAGVGHRKGDILGGIAGFGTKERLSKAYRFLIENYRNGDNIFIFGFSRGAFAARLFAGFLGYVGTLFGKPPFEDYLPHMYQIYESSVVLDVVGSFRGYLEGLGERTTPLPIHFLGVWDTVERYFPRRDLPEIETLARHIIHARHALAIHERRIEMEPTLWKKWAKGQTVKQMWFPGAHSDVGGGYPDARLASDALAWMHLEARRNGLKLLPVVPSGGTIILHQQRTKNAWVGGKLAQLLGEQVRSDLSPTDRNLIASMDFSSSARAHLGANPIPEKNFRFENFRKKDEKDAKAELKIADGRAKELLKKV